MSLFHNELTILPEVIKNIETAKADIGKLQIKMIIKCNKNEAPLGLWGYGMFG